MNKKMIRLIVLLVCLPSCFFAQQEYSVGVVGFYNLENLFDLEDDPEKRDDDFTPTGSYQYTSEVYQEKLDHLSTVISELGKEMSPDGVSLLGVAEIENRSVLEDLVLEEKIKDRNYQIVHYESPDERGIDVALLYNPKYFSVLQSKALPVELSDDTENPDYTRDILWVFGIYDGEPLHVFVNHWPSRRGGEVASSPLREKAAMVCKLIIDSILAENASAKIIVMGDLNDDPISPSVRDVLRAKGNKNEVATGGLYNPWWNMYKKGIGSLAWNDSWNLFDQIIVSQNFIDDTSEGYKLHKAEVYNKPYLVQKTGRYKGYPWRTYSRGEYIGGYSDHFPTFVYLVREH